MRFKGFRAHRALTKLQFLTDFRYPSHDTGLGFLAKGRYKAKPRVERGATDIKWDALV